MSRARVVPTTTLASFAMTMLLAAGCIFNPEKKPPEIVPPPPPPNSPAAVIASLSDAYQTRRYDRLVPLFHDDYLFTLKPDPLHPEQPIDWGKTEELRIHRRMFDPLSIPPSEDPLPMDLWLVSVTIQLTPSSAFDERMEFYLSATNPDGLDPANWKAWGTDYNTSVLFETQGDTDYQVTGSAYFVIIQDLTKTPGDVGSFLLYRWQDLGAGKPGRDVAI